ncbi:hypothetical protein CFC21_080242 [Triticum aestivum]|uniref:Uncharacterized protein n=4 Tax=Triticinae TaxID=1648030 RepID=A0A453M5N5_AEGTS|nr:uncharacterized protein LOC109770547 [Aegilops tauschii subsp. strangulata]XP_044402227.1 uncharacterized protein LOC123125845 [Triticum aestivum]KAF7075469.1 hypothetical protein CFC21_080242 [Triticum aestivum]
MGYWFFGGHGGFYIPSYDGSQPRPAGPHRPLLYGTVPYDEEIRRMEEGVRLRQRPPPNPTVWKYFKIFTRCFMAAMSITMMAWIFVARYFGSDPQVQDPYIMMGLIVFALIPMGFGLMITEGDIEAQDTRAQGEALSSPSHGFEDLRADVARICAFLEIR